MSESQIKKGAVLGYVILFLGNIIPLFYTPIMLRILGQEEYGLYSLATATTAYLALLNLGLGSALIKYTAKYRATDDREAESNLTGLFIIIFSVLSLIVLVIGAALVLNVNLIFGDSLSAGELSRIKVLMAVVVFKIALSLPLSVYNGLIMAHEKFIFHKLVALISTVVVPALNLIVLFKGYGSIGLVVILLLSSIATSLVNIVYCYSRLKIKPRFKGLDYSILREITTFTVFVFLGNIINMLYGVTDRFILGIYSGTAVVAVYSIGALLTRHYDSFARMLSPLLFPKITIMVTNRASKEELTAIFIKVGRLQYILLSFILSGFILFGQQFISLWAGAEYSDSYYIALILMVPVTIPLIQIVGLNILLAKNLHKFRTVIYAIIAVMNVVVSLYVVQIWGAIGIAFVSCAALLLGQGLAINIYYYKIIELDIPQFWSNILRISIPVLIALILGYAVGQISITEGWSSFFIFVIIYSIIFWVLMWFTGMNKYEKDLLTEPIKTLVMRLKNR